MIKPVSIVVLAALASLATGVNAQSSNVTIYGLVDLSVQQVRSGDRSPLAGQSQTRLFDGTTYGPGSRWGLRVNEDLGGGLAAGAVLEQGFLADTGALAQGGRGFGRQSFLLLRSDAVGELRLGRQYALHDETMALSNPAGNTTPLNPGGIYTLPTGTLPLFVDAPRVDNAIHYLSPMFGGFRVQGMVALSEGALDRYQGLKASYAAGSLKAAVAYEQSKASAPPAGGPSTVNKLLELAANYNFGSFTAFGGYLRGRDLVAGPRSQIQIGTLTLPGLAGVATKSSAYTVGALVPIGALDLMTNYTSARYGNATGGEVTVGRWGIGGRYALSKRTSLYSVVAFATGDLKDYANEEQIYQVGLRHAF